MAPHPPLSAELSASLEISALAQFLAVVAIPNCLNFTISRARKLGLEMIGEKPNIFIIRYADIALELNSFQSYCPVF